MTRAGFVLAVMLLSAVAPCAAGACISTPEQKTEKFAAADKDGDGVLSPAEFFAQLPQQRC